MKQLEKEFIGGGDVKGFKLKQLKANGYVFLYEINTGYSKHYEVFEHRETKESDNIISGVEVHFNAKITYPSSKAFGVWAYCCDDLDRANMRYNELTEIVRQRIENK